MCLSYTSLGHQVTVVFEHVQVIAIDHPLHGGVGIVDRGRQSNIDSFVP